MRQTHPAQGPNSLTLINSVSFSFNPLGFLLSLRGTPSMAQAAKGFALGHPWCRGLRAKEKA